MKTSGTRFAAGLAVLVLTTSVAAALTVKEPRDQLDLLSFSDPQLRVVEVPVASDALRGVLPSVEAMDRFRAANGSAWRFTVDARRGVPSLLGGGALPIIPGAANDLPWEQMGACRETRCIPVAAVEGRIRDLLGRWPEIFPVPADELTVDPDGSGPFGASTYLLRLQWSPNGVPVDGGSIYVRISGGNLIQIATETVSPATLDPSPAVDRGAAVDAVRSYLGPFASPSDRWFDKGTLRFVPLTPAGQDPDELTAPPGEGIEYRLVWRLGFERPGVVGRWEALVDTQTGELLRFVDANRYGRVHGGAYPRDDHSGEADRPFPFVDIGAGQYADSGGLFPGDTATVTLNGRYTRIDDACGPINATTTDGDVDLGLGPGTDCDTPPGNTAGGGNTHAARTQYYHLTNVNMKARTFLPSNSWLNNDHMNVNTNQDPWCNATSGSGTLNFYRPESWCWNLGELPGVSLHEWGHSMDDFDGSGGDSPPVETRADWTAILSTHDPCVGRGFYLSGTCGGYGDPCLDCSGIRDADYTRHSASTPWTPANHGSVWSCGGGWYYGPCGWEDHCESGLSTQALWDFVHRDLAAAGVDLATAWLLADRIFYTSMPTLGDLYTCSPPTSSGCNGGSLYSTMMALDDDGDGTANGTPHAAAIFAALDRHNIACHDASDPRNQSTSSCPTLAAPTVAASPGSDAATVSWGAVPSATRYLVFRNDIGCDAGFSRVGEVAAPATELVDTTVVNGIEYLYRVQAAAAHDSCVSPASACVAVTPQPCAGAVALDSTSVNCADSLGLRVIDGDLAGDATLDVTVWSDSEPTPETITLSADPPGSGSFAGAVATSTDTTPGDGVVGVGHGDTVTVRYHDASYCGSPVDVDATATTDCQPPVISGVASQNVTGTSAEIVWSTDEPADGAVLYGASQPPGSPADEAGMTTAHLVRLTGLSECSRYYYQVSSSDAAGNSAVDDAGGAYFRLMTGENNTPSYASTDTPISIPDDNATGVSSTITLTDASTVLDVDVTVDIPHTYPGDLELYLAGPNGVEITLSDHNGGSGDGYLGTTFDDEASTPITSGSSPFSGSFQPEDSLSTFDGLSAAGTWTLRVADTWSWDTGTLESWTLTLTHPSEPCLSADGTVEMGAVTYGCTDSVTVTVMDQDLVGVGSHTVEVSSATEPSPEVVTIAEDPAESGVLTGSFVLSPNAPFPGDGLLSVVDGDTVTVLYVDADDGLGGSNIDKTATASVVCGAHLIFADGFEAGHTGAWGDAVP